MRGYNYHIKTFCWICLLVLFGSKLSLAYFPLFKVLNPPKFFSEPRETAQEKRNNFREEVLLLKMRLIKKFEENKYFEVVKIFETSKLRDKELSPDIYYLVGVSYHYLGREKSALDYLQKALQLAPDKPEILEAMGLVYFGLDFLELAEDFLFRAYQMSSENPQYLLTYIATLLKSGKFEEAQLWLNEFAHKYSLYKYPWYYYYKGMWYIYKNKPKVASSCFKTFLRLAGSKVLDSLPLKYLKQIQKLANIKGE